MKKLTLLISGIILSISITYSQTYIPGGNVSGTWTKANSPYIVEGYITIQNSDLLTINPGVEVIFSAVDFGLTVEGMILAEGTHQDSIKFTTNSVEWRRIKFLNTNSNGQDSSKMVYCIVEKGMTYEDSYHHGGGIYCENSDKLLINHCLIRDNNAVPGNGGGIGLSFSNPMITNSKICDNDALSTNSYGGGIWCSASDPTLKNLLIINNEVSGEDTFGGGISVTGSNPIIENLTIYGNILDGSTIQHGGGIFYNNSSGVTEITNSVVRNNTSDEIYVDVGTLNVSYSNIEGGFTGLANIDADPLFKDVPDADFRLTWGNFPIVDATKSPCIDAGDPASPLNPDGTQADMGAIYWHHGTRVSCPVSGTWALSGSPYIFEDYNCVILSDDELIIEAGVEIIFFDPIYFNIYGRIYADGEETNPISFMPDDPSIGWRGIRFINTSTNGQDHSLLNHCNISSSSAYGGSDYNNGGAIYCENSSDVWIFNCEIENNYAVQKGGGIYCLDSDILLSNNLIQDNRAGEKGGGIYCENSDIVASNIYIRDNIAGEEGGGLYLKFSDPDIEHSQITGNEAELGGGALFNNCGGNINSVEIVGNNAEYAGGLFFSSTSSTVMEKVTLSENSATYTGGAIHCIYSDPVIQNSIVWNNYGIQEIYIDGNSDPVITYSDIKLPGMEVWQGTGNINSDPLFIDPPGWDFNFSWPDYPKQSTKSPCIDTGDPSSTPDPDGTRTDMGALPYEQTYTPITGGDISGTLTCTGGPYNVFGDITVPAGEELILEPCVYLIFQGDYRLTVNGRLLAEGTEEDVITFYPADKNTGWQGIRFYDSNTNGLDSSKLVHCNIRNGNANGGYGNDNNGGGLFLFNSSDVLIDHCQFLENKAETSGGAMFLTSGSSPVISNSIFSNNSALNGGAIWCYDNTNPDLINCNFLNNAAENGGVIGMSSCAPSFSGCLMTQNRATKFGGAIYHDASGPPTFDNLNRCNIYDNYADYAGLDFYTTAGYYNPPVLDIYLDTASVALMNEHFAYPFQYFNIISDNARFEQEDSDLYVSTSGSDLNSGTSASDPLATIKMALIKVISDSADPKTIHIANGVYSVSETGETLPINHRSHTTLSGEFHTTTNIDGDSLHRIMISYADVNNSVENLRLQNGFVNGDGGAVIIEYYSNPSFYLCDFINNYCTGNGGAVWCHDHCSPEFDLSYISNNYADNSGGGLFMQSNDSILFNYTSIAGNTSRHAGGGIWSEYHDYLHVNVGLISWNTLLNGGGGGAFFRQGKVLIDSTVFIDNHTFGVGGGLHTSYNVDLELTRSTFTNNRASGWGGGMYFYLGVDANLENVKFYGNSSVHGGAIYGHVGSTLDIRNGLFSGNNTLYDTIVYGKGNGGAMSLSFVETNLYNITVANNVSSMIGGGLYFYSDVSTIQNVQNSIVYNNTPQAISTEYDASVAVNYSDIEGGWPTGMGNFAMNPNFSGVYPHHYSLNDLSPCIDMGNPDTTGFSLPDTDLAGNPRIGNDRIDMGAYEYYDSRQLNLKVFLEGPFNGSDMDTNLLQSGSIPFDQPFNFPPWNFYDVVSVSSIPDSVVDWVLLELRHSPSYLLITRVPLFLKHNGEIIDVTGGPVLFQTNIPDIRAVIHHRNHLSIMSADPLLQTGDIYSYDFTTGAVQAFGTDAQKDLGSGVFGMYGGDADANGIIELDDKTIFWLLQAGKVGYLVGDFDLDGQVNNKDKNEIWLQNIYEESQLPD